MSDTECRYCRHYAEGNEEVGQCRRYPPENIEDEDGEGFSIEYPLVQASLWCGEFSRKVN